MKGQVAVIESIIAIIILLISFNVFVQDNVQENKWKEAITSLNGKDALITADRLGQLHNYAFSESTFRSEFLNKLDSVSDSIIKVDTQGTLKESVYVACDCTDEQVTYLRNILNDVKFNDREINVDVCSSDLPAINPCTAGQQYPDVLVIWGYRDLSPYLGNLDGFVRNGNSIIEIADMQQNQVGIVQERIFGLKWIDEVDFPPNQNEFLKPRNASATNYQGYKWFYHLPYLLEAPDPADLGGGGPPPVPPGQCSTANEGNFRFQDTDHMFWICENTGGGRSVYFDEDGDGRQDTGRINEGEKFSIGSSNFLLNYIESTSSIRISFKPDYVFNDFLVKDNSHNKMVPWGGDENKVLISAGYWDVLRENPISVVIFNGTERVKTGWLPDFSRDPGGLDSTGDDHKQLLASVVLSISNKGIKDTSPTLGQITSYINTVNNDMLEIYRVDLGIGSPF